MAETKNTIVRKATIYGFNVVHSRYRQIDSQLVIDHTVMMEKSKQLIPQVDKYLIDKNRPSLGSDITLQDILSGFIKHIGSTKIIDQDDKETKLLEYIYVKVNEIVAENGHKSLESKNITKDYFVNNVNDMAPKLRTTVKLLIKNLGDNLSDIWYNLNDLMVTVDSNMEEIAYYKYDYTKEFEQHCEEKNCFHIVQLLWKDDYLCLQYYDFRMRPVVEVLSYNDKTIEREYPNKYKGTYRYVSAIERIKQIYNDRLHLELNQYGD